MQLWFFCDDSTINIWSNFVPIENHWCFFHLPLPFFLNHSAFKKHYCHVHCVWLQPLGITLPFDGNCSRWSRVPKVRIDTVDCLINSHFILPAYSLTEPSSHLSLLFFYCCDKNIRSTAMYGRKAHGSRGRFHDGAAVGAGAGVGQTQQ